jgi:lipopolysaccharide transport system permease protein
MVNPHASPEIPGVSLLPRAAPSVRTWDEHAEPEGVVRELWVYRELLFFLSWRDIKVRYRQTFLGVSWALIQPLLTMAIFTVLFGRVANLPTDGVPRPLFYFSALVPWLYISNAVSNASMSFVSNANLITKIYFPRIMLPAAVVVSGLLDFLIGSLLLVGFIIYYRVSLGWSLLLWPALVLQMFVLALGLGMFLSALNIRFRDVKYAVPFLMQLWLFVTPVIYPTSMIPARFQSLLAVNPAGGLVEAFRHLLIPSVPMRWNFLGISALTTAVVFLLGFAFFRKTERAFADII